MPRYLLHCCDLKLEGVPEGRISSGDAAGKYIALVSREKGYAFVHDVTGALLARHDIDYFQAVRIAPDGFHIVYSLVSNRLYAFRIGDPIPYWEKDLSKLGKITSLDMAKAVDGRIAVGSDRGVAIFTREGLLVASNKLCHKKLCKSRMVTALAWDDEGARLAVATKDSRLLVLDRDGEIWAETGLPAPATKLAWISDMNVIVAGLVTGEIVVVVLTSIGRLVIAAGRGLGDRIDAIAGSPLGDILVAWRTSRGASIASMSIDTRNVWWSEELGEYRVKRIAVLEEESIIVITDSFDAIFTLEPVLKRAPGGPAEESNRSITGISLDSTAKRRRFPLYLLVLGLGRSLVGRIGYLPSLYTLF